MARTLKEGRSTQHTEGGRLLSSINATTNDKASVDRGSGTAAPFKSMNLVSPSTDSSTGRKGLGKDKMFHHKNASSSYDERPA